MTSPSNNSAQRDKRVEEILLKFAWLYDDASIISDDYAPGMDRKEALSQLNQLIDDEVRKARIDERRQTTRMIRKGHTRYGKDYHLIDAAWWERRGKALNNKTDKEEV